MQNKIRFHHAQHVNQAYLLRSSGFVDAVIEQDSEGESAVLCFGGATRRISRWCDEANSCRRSCQLTRQQQRLFIVSIWIMKMLRLIRFTCLLTRQQRRWFGDSMIFEPDSFCCRVLRVSAETWAVVCTWVGEYVTCLLRRGSVRTMKFYVFHVIFMYLQLS